MDTDASTRSQIPSDRELRQLQGPEADAIANLGSCISDMKRAQATCASIANISHAQVAESLFASAIIDYSRCFATGVRVGVDQDTYVRAMSLNDVMTHEEVVNLRNKLVAHSVNSLEQYLAVVYLHGPSTGKRGIAAVGALNMRKSLLDTGLVERLATLLGQGISALDMQLEKLTSAMWKRLDEYDVEDLYAASALAFNVRAAPTDYSKPRKPSKK
jgi:hypothetical protein